MDKSKKDTTSFLEAQVVSDNKSTYGLRTYVSLFSSAGIGCYGFKEENFHCIATVELLERRLKIQEYNQKCTYPSGYICGDLTKKETKEKTNDDRPVKIIHKNGPTVGSVLLLMLKIWVVIFVLFPLFCVDIASALGLFL